MSIGAVGGVIQHLQLYLLGQRFTAEHAARIASLLLAASILGRIVMGYLADRFAKNMMLAACLMIAGTIHCFTRLSIPVRFMPSPWSSVLAWEPITCSSRC